MSRLTSERHAVPFLPAYENDTFLKLTEPSLTSVTGSAGLLIVLSSSRTSTIRSAEALDIVIITSTIDTIMRLMSICEAYEIMLVSCPVVIAPSAPCPFIIRLAPNHDIKSIEPYTASCMSGPLKASILSARVNSR